MFLWSVGLIEVVHVGARVILFLPFTIIGLETLAEGHLWSKRQAIHGCQHGTGEGIMPPEDVRRL